MAHFLYFAWVREKIGVSDERVSLPHGVGTVTQVLQFLQERGPNYHDALGDPSLRVAVNQNYAHGETLVTDADEIAFFPPVSGG